MLAKFAVISVWAEDVAAAGQFYRDVLGLEMLPHLHRRKRCAWSSAPRTSIFGDYLKRPSALGLFLREIVERVEHFHVVGPLECARLSHRFLTHAALHLRDRLIFVLFHPGFHFFQDLGDSPDPILE